MTLPEDYREDYKDRAINMETNTDKVLQQIRRILMDQTIPIYKIDLLRDRHDLRQELKQCMWTIEALIAQKKGLLDTFKESNKSLEERIVAAEYSLGVYDRNKHSDYFKLYTYSKAEELKDRDMSDD